jgi:hypothetical protein
LVDLDIELLRSEFKAKVCDEIDLQVEGIERFIIHTPFTFDDGDHFKIVLKRSGKVWVFSDEGHTFMHISYEDINLDTTTRQEVIEKALYTYSVKNEDGELISVIDNGSYGDALFSFIQGLTHISDVTYLKRERVRSAFMGEFRTFIEETLPEERVIFEYHDPTHDPTALYPVDCYIKTETRPIFLFAIPNDAKCRDTTIEMRYFENLDISFSPVAIFQNQEEINRKVLARFSDVCEKQFPSIQSAKERFNKFLTPYGLN